MKTYSDCSAGNRQNGYEGLRDYPLTCSVCLNTGDRIASPFAS